MYSFTGSIEHLIQEERVTSTLEHLDQEVNLLLDAATEDEVHKQIRISILSDMSFRLMKELGDPYMESFLKILQRIIPSGHSKFPTLIGSCILLAAIRLYESEEENVGNEYAIYLVGIIDEIYEI